MEIYQAACWCDDCAALIRASLDREGKRPDDPEHDFTYDSDDYPKSVLEDDSDLPTHCEAGESCINAETLPSGRKIGCILGGLTEVGVEYVRGASGEVADYWREHFDI